jgi:cytochrome c
MKLIVVVVASIFLFQENHPPVVKLTTSATASAQSPLTYSINVSDKEDGETKFDEINPNEILLQVQYGDNGKKNDVSALHAMMASNCMNCHAFKSKLIGPSYLDISNKYSSSDAATLVKHVKEGSKGIWGDIVMPTHPELSDDEISKMVNWIVSYNGNKSSDFFLGKEGSVQLQRSGKVTLTASYLDHHNTMGEDRVQIDVK